MLFRKKKNQKRKAVRIMFTHKISTTQDKVLMSFVCTKMIQKVCGKCTLYFTFIFHELFEAP